MITQKQIDTRDEYIKELEGNIKHTIPYTPFKRPQLRQAIANADKEAAEMKNEMLDILISFCDGNCGVVGYCEEAKCHDTCALRETKDVIERATGLSIDEAIKAWEARK